MALSADSLGISQRKIGAVKMLLADEIYFRVATPQIRSPSDFSPLISRIILHGRHTLIRANRVSRLWGRKKTPWKPVRCKACNRVSASKNQKWTGKHNPAQESF
jgi:hypothetical protein